MEEVGAKKQPHLIGEPFAFAGLWEHWRGDDAEIDSCTIIAGEPNELAARVRDRMPVILRPKDYDVWVDPKNADGTS